MGCCLGTTAVNHRQPLKAPAPKSPPPVYEEETVKEVLSEIPVVPKNPPPVIADHPQILQPQQRAGPDLTKKPPPVILDHPQVLLQEKREGVDLTKNPTEEIQENVSDMSEMYSYSESYSAATTATVADAKKDDLEMDDDGEVTEKVKTRSPPAKRVPRKRPLVSSGEVVGKKERATTRPLARRQMAPSPEKRRQSPVRTVANAQRHRNVGPVNDARREVTARRSRSPAVRGEMGERRKVIRERSPVGKPVEVKPVNAVEIEGKSTIEMVNDGGVSPDPEAEPPVSESLENPLVSLECFIFL